MIPTLPTDPKNREQLEAWLKRREEDYPNEPLTAREALMIQGLQNRRKPYSEM